MEERNQTKHRAQKIRNIRKSQKRYNIITLAWSAIMGVGIVGVFLGIGIILFSLYLLNQSRLEAARWPSGAHPPIAFGLVFFTFPLGIIIILVFLGLLIGSVLGLRRMKN